MRYSVIPIVAGMVFFATPVFADSTGAAGARTDRTTGAESADHAVSASTQQKIRQSLEQSGFKNVQVAPQSFMIRARAPDGSHVVMSVSPDRLAGVVFEPAAASGSTTAPDSGSTNAPDMQREEAQPSDSGGR